ncbi:MAG: hypothetical protein NTY57_00345 [Solirubrobacterales bacterium]|nr:hypothetical protein [Solirubrobacterales bacterium]
MSQPGVHRSTIRFLAAAMVVVGIALVVRAISAGGGVLSIGVLMGLLFVAAGVGRYWLTVRGE